MAKKTKTINEKVKVIFQKQTRFDGKSYRPNDTAMIALETAERWAKMKMPIAIICTDPETK